MTYHTIELAVYDNFTQILKVRLLTRRDLQNVNDFYQMREEQKLNKGNSFESR